MIEIISNEERAIKKHEKEMQSMDKVKLMINGILRIHALFSIFSFYDKTLSRPARFAVIYLKYFLLMSFSSLFPNKDDMYTTLVICIFVAFVGVIPMAIL